MEVVRCYTREDIREIQKMTLRYAYKYIVNKIFQLCLYVLILSFPSFVFLYWLVIGYQSYIEIGGYKMNVYIAKYEGTDESEILGAFFNLEDAIEKIQSDYRKTKIWYTPKVKRIDREYIYISDHDWYDEWSISQTELH